MMQTALLKYLFEKTQGISESRFGKKVTGNDFLLAVLDLVKTVGKDRLPSALNGEETEDELNAVENVLKKYKINEQEAILDITEKVTDGAYAGREDADAAAFRTVCCNAELTAHFNDTGAVDAVLLLDVLLSDPTDIISGVITPKDAPIEKTQEKTDKSEKSDGLSFAQFVKKRALETEDSDDEDMPEDEEEDAEPTAQELSGSEKLAKIVDETRKVQSMLLSRVYGQDHAVNAFASGYFQAQVARETGRSAKPQATFLFAGPPGVGKTFLAETVAEALGRPFMRFDMSEYSENESGNEFCGSDGIYKSSKEGNVTGFVSKNPECVLLFDEIEKAHINVIHLFLQMLDAGRLRDNHTDKEVSFTKAIIILTTNAGKNLYDDTSIENLSLVSRKKIIKALSTDINPLTKVPLFPAAICSRFASGNVVMFNRLGVNNLFTIASKALRGEADDFERAMGIRIDFDSEVPTAIILANGGNADARTVKGRAMSFFHDEMYELFRLAPTEGRAVDKLKRVKIGVSLEKNGEISEMFVSSVKPEVLIFTGTDRAKVLSQSMSEARCHITDSIDEARELMLGYDISLILCDIYCGKNESRSVLNVEDITSVGREFLTMALSQGVAPVYLIQMNPSSEKISKEELLSLSTLGVKGMVSFEPDGEKALAERIRELCDIEYQQRVMIRLAREGKVVSYRTAQTISEDQESAEIVLFGFKRVLAADVEDSESIIDDASKPNVHFDDVIGAEEAKRELTYFTEYLKNPAKYLRSGLRVPRGVLLYGPPGTGKTMLAKAMAGESNVTFLSTEGNKFLKKYIGEGVEAVHKLFASARKYAPAVVFIDEIDAIGADRASSEESGGKADTLTAFLTEMDGFNTDTTKPVFVLAATNYAIDQSSRRRLDPALLRRFDRRIYVDLPNKDERVRFIRMKASKAKLVRLSDQQIENIAIRSTGMSLAAIDSVFEMALRSAVRVEGGIVDDAAFDEAFETFNGGEKRTWSKGSLISTARHEAGHALLCWLGGEKPSYVTIVARGDYGGYMRHADNEGKGKYTKAELLSLIRTSMAGRAAELVCYGEEDGLTTGASADLRNAMNIAEDMICLYGMDEKIGLSSLDTADKNGAYYSEVRARVNEILTAELESAKAAIRENREALDAIVDALMEKNHLKENEIDEIFTRTVKRK